MSSNRFFQNICAAVELGIMWCLWMVVGFIAGYMPGAKGGYSIFRCIQLRSVLGNIPYETLIKIAQGKKTLRDMELPSADGETSEIVSKEDIVFYTFMMNKKVRHGLRSFIGCLLLIVAIASGFDWLILYFVIAGLFLLGLTKFVQGVMEIT